MEKYKTLQPLPWVPVWTIIETDIRGDYIYQNVSAHADFFEEV